MASNPVRKHDLALYPRVFFGIEPRPMIFAAVMEHHAMAMAMTASSRLNFRVIVRRVSSRFALMKRYLRLFGAGSVKVLLADREFVGLDWLRFLNKNNIRFVIRVKQNMTVIAGDGRRFSLASLLRKARGQRYFQAALPGSGKAGPLWLGFAAKRIRKGELLIVATSGEPRHALNTYRKRWSIECLFGDAKTRGLIRCAVPELP